MKLFNRQEFIKGCARVGVLGAILGLCAVLASRKEKFECSNRCGQCSKLNNGKCELGLK